MHCLVYHHSGYSLRVLPYITTAGDVLSCMWQCNKNDVWQKWINPQNSLLCASFDTLVICMVIASPLVIYIYIYIYIIFSISYWNIVNCSLFLTRLLLESVFKTNAGPTLHFPKNLYSIMTQVWALMFRLHISWYRDKSIVCIYLCLFSRI